MEEIFAILKGPLDVDIIISLIYVHIFKVFIFLVLCYVLYFVKRPRGLPPGPYGYPIIGSLPDMSQDLSTGFSRIGRKYGSVFTVWMGSDRYWVVLNDYEAIKEAYVTRGAEFSDRDPDTDSEDTIFNAHYDEIYKESRKITAQAVRTFIKDRLDSKLQAEMTKLHTYMADQRKAGQPIDLKPHITRVFGNVIFNIVFNMEFKHGDPDADQLFTTLRNWFVGGFELEILESLPLGSGHLYGMRKQTIEYDRLQTHLETVVERFINQHKATFKQSDVRDVLDAYLKVEGLERFGKRKVINTLLTLLPDSTATSVFTCQFLFLYLLNFPKYQDAILAEINCVKGDGMISILDRPSMPITESFIMEVLRKANPASVGIPTKPSKQTQLRGHTIPAHVDIFPNYKGVHYDPKIFPEPDAFKPERFLKDGKVENIQGFIPFGMGRRMCIGEHLVRNNLFLFLTNMIQKYQIKAGPSGVPSLQKDESSVVGQPYDFELVLDYRN